MVWLWFIVATLLSFTLALQLSPMIVDRRLVISAVASSVLVSQGNSSYVPSIFVVQDPETYSALAFVPPRRIGGSFGGSDQSIAPPLVLVLHGAGRNELPILQGLGDPNGEHAGLLPSLIASELAPPELLENFAVLAPYSLGQPSFYQDSRSKLLKFVEWAKTDACPVLFDPNRILLLGFSDGATVAVELMTTRKFAAGVICSYGFTGRLPTPALELLKGLPIWVFHSADDVIFNVTNSDRLVEQLRSSSRGSSAMVRYSRFDNDPEHLPARVRGHSTGITASKSSDVYDWLLQIPPIQ